MCTKTAAIFNGFAEPNFQYVDEDRVSPLKIVLFPTFGFPHKAMVKSESINRTSLEKYMYEKYFYANKEICRNKMEKISCKMGNFSVQCLKRRIYGKRYKL